MCRVRILMLVLALSAGLFVQTGRAQEQGHAERRVVRKVEPVYPAMALLNRIRGVVRLELVVAANGKVTSAKVLGGSPLLAYAATNAARQWRFEAAPTETTEIVRMEFLN